MQRLLTGEAGDPELGGYQKLSKYELMRDVCGSGKDPPDCLLSKSSIVRYFSIILSSQVLCGFGPYRVFVHGAQELSTGPWMR